MFFIGTAQFPLPFRCVLSFGRAAVAVPRGRYAVRSGVRFAAFGGAVRRTFRSGFRTGQGQRVPRHAVTSLRVRGEGAVPEGRSLFRFRQTRGRGCTGSHGGRSSGRLVSSYRCPVVAEAVFLCGSWRKTFAGDGVSGVSVAGGARSFPQTVLLRPAPRFAMQGRRTPLVAGPYRAARSGAPAAPDRRVKRPVPSFGSCVSGPPGPTHRSPPGRSVSRTGAGERQDEGRVPRFFCVRAAGMRIVSQKALYLHRTGTDLPNRK